MLCSISLQDFLQVFDQTNKGGVDEEEFYVLVIVVKQLLMEPLDKDALRVRHHLCYRQVGRKSLSSSCTLHL